MASSEADPSAAHKQAVGKLRDEFDLLCTELTGVVNSAEGGPAALRAAIELLETARDRVHANLQSEAFRRARQVDPPDEEDAMLLTEDGDRLVTEDGGAIKLEGDVRATEDYEHRVTEDYERQITEGAAFGDTVEAEIVRPAVPASGWTGRLSQEERVQVIKTLGPVAQSELQTLIDRVAHERFNDELTRDALEQLKRLHDVLGQLIAAADQGKPLDQLLAAFGQNRDKLLSLLKQGTNVVVAAPAMTFGIVELLAALFSVPTDDGGLVGTVYAAMLYKLCGKKTD